MWCRFTQSKEATVLFSAGSILIEIEESTILAQFFRIEIVKKSILEYLPKSAKIEIEQFWNRPSSSLFFGIKAKKHNFYWVDSYQNRRIDDSDSILQNRNREKIVL